MTYQVETPILNSPFDPPAAYWSIREGSDPEKKPDRRPPIVYPPRDGKTDWNLGEVLAKSRDFAPGYEMTLVSLIRQRVREWQQQNYPGTTRTTRELLAYWNRDGRERRLFFAQREAVETIIFLIEARQDFRQGIQIPADDALKPFLRYACKMATGCGKTTVMAMLGAWSILNKVSRRNDKRFSDTVLVVCPNVTIKSRLQELNPANGEASLYRTRDLVPSHLMAKLRQGRVLVTNWHLFEKRSPQTPGNDSAKVVKVGVPETTTEIINLGSKNDTARGKRYLTLESLEQQKATQQIKVLEEETDKGGNLIKVRVETTRYLESDAAWIKRVLGQHIGNKGNILVFNDEAHHAYRIAPDDDSDSDDELADYNRKEATIWIEGLDRIHQQRRINFCVDLSATPYYLKAAGKDANKPFEWTVSDFSLMDAIESGLVKIPQLPARDTTGKQVSEMAYFNIWEWIIGEMTSAEKGKKAANPKPEAVLKYAQHPLSILGGQWRQLLGDWSANDGEGREPDFIIVCKNTKTAKVIYEWIAEGQRPGFIPECRITELRNTEEKTNTIRVDSKVVEEMESDNAKNDETKWMRYCLDTVGQKDWPQNENGLPIYPEEFEKLAEKLNRPHHPPGRDARCIVSVGMLTEGWDCRTVTHIIGIRPFMSQLLCEQVVGRGLRRRSYELTEEGKFAEETATVFGVPFEVVPFKANPGGSVKAEKRHRVYAVPAKTQYKIEFPRVDGYTQAVRNRVKVDWEAIAPLEINPFKIAPELEVKATLASNEGRYTLCGPGKLESIDLNPYRLGQRFQELVFDLAADLTRSYCQSDKCEAPPHVLFPQLRQICDRYLETKVAVIKPANIFDVFLSPYYGWVVEKLTAAIFPDTDAGEAPEIPRYEAHRGPGSTDDIDFWTAKPVKEVMKSHLNCVVADTWQWEQAAAYIIDTHPGVEAFVKNQSLGFVISYLHNGQYRDYIPDFIIRLKAGEFLILETKGYDELREVKKAAALRWVNAVNADGKYGRWRYEMAGLKQVRELLDEAVARVAVS
jgi:type III restriction enzyme